jgi:hypothetical protein
MKQYLILLSIILSLLVNFGAIAKDYDRKAYGGWKDFDRDCQNQRHELLISLSTMPVTFTNAKQCTVKQGKWISPYTNGVIYSAKEIDIDHILPVSLSWYYGAKYWTKQERIEFYNDPINIVPVEKRLNRQKGAKDITEWLPPKNQCGYIARFMRVIKKYNLKPPEKKMRQFEKLVHGCRKSN